MSKEQKHTILCVDDEKFIVESLQDVFMDTYNVKIALSGKEALEIFDKEDIALVVSDQRMPEMDGTELLAEINKKKPFCKKILLTGYADIKASIDAINKGSVDKYFSKPWDDDELLNAAKHLLSLYKMDKFMNKMLNDGISMKDRLSNALASEELLKASYDSYPSGLCVLDADEKIKYINQKGLAILNYSDLTKVENKKYKDVFEIDDSTLSVLKKEFQKEELTFKDVNATLNKNEKKEVSISLLFKKGSDAKKINGIVFKAI